MTPVGVGADDPERERRDAQHGEDEEGEQGELDVETSRITTVPTSVSVEPKSVTMPSVTSWSSACTSLVRREMSTPAWRREKKPTDMRLQVGEELDAQVLQRRAGRSSRRGRSARTRRAQ